MSVSLTDVSNWMTQYIMSIFLVVGILGNVINIYMFTRKESFRNSCSLYLLAASILNILSIIWGICPSLYTLYNTDPSTYSFIYCKLRLYTLHTLLMIVTVKCVYQTCECHPANAFRVPFIERLICDFFDKNQITLETLKYSRAASDPVLRLKYFLDILPESKQKQYKEVLTNSSDDTLLNELVAYEILDDKQKKPHILKLIKPARNSSSDTTKHYDLLNEKHLPTLNYGYLVQFCYYFEYRLRNLNSLCVMCGKRTVNLNDNKKTSKPTICDDYECFSNAMDSKFRDDPLPPSIFSIEIADFLLLLLIAAIRSTRHGLILDPYPKLINPYNTSTTLIDQDGDKEQNIKTLREIIDGIISMGSITQYEVDRISLRITVKCVYQTCECHPANAFRVPFIERLIRDFFDKNRIPLETLKYSRAAFDPVLRLKYFLDILPPSKRTHYEGMLINSNDDTLLNELLAFEILENNQRIAQKLQLIKPPRNSSSDTTKHYDLLNEKHLPTLNYGYLVQFCYYFEYRLRNLNSLCVMCGKRTVSLNDIKKTSKPTICDDYECFSNAMDSKFRNDPLPPSIFSIEIADFLLLLLIAAIKSTRHGLILDPYPKLINPYNTSTTLIDQDGDKEQNIKTLREIIDGIISMGSITQYEVDRISLRIIKTIKINLFFLFTNGGVAVGTVAASNIGLHSAMIISTLAGMISVLGFEYLLPILKRIRIHDTCGVNNLHGMSGIEGTIVASIDNRSGYLNHLTDQCLSGGISRSNSIQAAALGLTLDMGIIGGLITGVILRIPIFAQKDNDFDDEENWRLPQNVHEIFSTNDSYADTSKYHSPTYL
ncbi:unnamed protein product [Adineta steineri]|uniref:Ammonium transporter AmtB-like domain-containing protein n=2 Tax=Adineta steineri TaxID=433720 RepID=A0A813Q1I1_9BILA|nr:unnamed protein product [Adineta steineri]